MRARIQNPVGGEGEDPNLCGRRERGVRSICGMNPASVG